MAWRVTVAAAISAVLMFAWGFVYWGPVCNATARLMAPLPEAAELDVIAPLRAENVVDGMYVYPGPMVEQRDEAIVEAWNEKLKAGPVFHLAYHQAGISPMEPTMFAKGLAHGFVIALLAGILLAMVRDSLPSYGGRVIFLTLVALIAAIWTNVANVIWWFHTPTYCGGQILYQVVAGLLMALVTAAIVRPTALASAPASR